MAPDDDQLTPEEVGDDTGGEQTEDSGQPEPNSLDIIQRERVAEAQRQELGRNVSAKPRTKPQIAPTTDPKPTGASLGGGREQAKQNILDKAKNQVKERIADQAKKWLAELAKKIGQAVVQLATKNPYVLGAIAVIIILVVVLIIFLVVIPAINKSTGRETGGRGVNDPPTHVSEDTFVKRLLALSGNLKASEELIEETALALREILEKVGTEIDRLPPENQEKAKAQLEKTKQALEELIAAVEKAKEANAKDKTASIFKLPHALAADDPETPEPTETSTPTTVKKKNSKKFPKYVLDARDKLLEELEKLAKLIEISCDTLPAANSKGLLKLPQSTAYGVYDDESMKYGTPKLICFLEKVGAEWQRRHPGNKIEIGDMSDQYGGNSGRHESHTNGEHADVWGPKLVFADIQVGKFDRDLAREFAKLLWDYGAVDVIFNDPILLQEDYDKIPSHPKYGKRLTREEPGHENHWHVQIQ